MPNKRKMKSKKKITFVSFGRELIKVEISLFIEGIEFMLFKGRRILRFLRDLKFTVEVMG